AEYKSSGKPFMGDRVEVNDVPLHMSGVGVYMNPLHEKAGEAYRAHDTAWDMAAREQIVPNAHFTDLIEHAWKHPTFTSIDELSTQISDKTVLFHSSKDGSLIRLLRQKRGGTKVAIHDENEPGPTPGSPSPLLRSAQGNISPFQYETAPTCDIFIRTYPNDYEWLNYCLDSIRKYCSGFRKVWVVSPEAPSNAAFHIPNGEWKVMNDESEDGYLAQQITKLYADVI